MSLQMERGKSRCTCDGDAEPFFHGAHSLRAATVKKGLNETSPNAAISTNAFPVSRIWIVSESDLASGFENHTDIDLHNVSNPIV